MCAAKTSKILSGVSPGVGDFVLGRVPGGLFKTMAVMKQDRFLVGVWGGARNRSRRYDQ